MKDFKIDILNGDYHLTLTTRDIYNNLDVVTITIDKEQAEKIMLSMECQVVYN